MPRQGGQRKSSGHPCAMRSGPAARPVAQYRPRRQCSIGRNPLEPLPAVTNRDRACEMHKRIAHARPNPSVALRQRSSRPANRGYDPSRHIPRPRGIGDTSPRSRSNPTPGVGVRAAPTRAGHRASLIAQSNCDSGMNEPRGPSRRNCKTTPRGRIPPKEPELAADLGHLPNEPELHLEQQGHQQRPARAHPSKRTQALPPSAARLAPLGLSAGRDTWSTVPHST